MIHVDLGLHTFAIGEQDFLLDGQPFVVRCGEIHFPRVPREYWRHRLQMCRAMGLNTVCVYLFWNLHEWEEGTFDWSGQADAAEFCRLAQEEGLWVLLRPGPYSCAEWEMGGLPWWLLKREGIRLRSSDPKFLDPAVRFLKEVGRVLGPQQITKGGPLLMVQVENEYGSFGNDAEYIGLLREALIEGGFEVPLFTCNPPGDLRNGYREDLFPVVNFGPGAAPSAFATLREVLPKGPLMNGEYYPAWFDMWGRRHRTQDAEPICRDLDYMLTHRHSFSIYMAHGGTSFDLWAGADRPFSPDTSSYDYDAPVSEAGWVTPKFDAIREVMLRHLLPGETATEPPSANPVTEFAPVTLTQFASVFSNLPCPRRVERPETFESYDQSRGFAVYRTTVPAGPAGGLKCKAVHDFGWIYLDGELLGILDRRNKRFEIELPERATPTQLDILVHTMGRVNFGQEVADRKGLHGQVELSGKELLQWEIFPFPLQPENLERLEFGPAEAGPGFWRGTFEVSAPGDTFLDVRTWGKGVAWVNGRCLGRFWNIGPQQTMYVPGPWLRRGVNEIVLLDLSGPTQPQVAGIRFPILDELHPERDFSARERAGGTFEATEPVASGTFTPDVAWQGVTFEAPVVGRYLALEALTGYGSDLAASAAEFDAIGPDGTSLSRADWKIFWVSSEETNYFPGDAENAIDGQNATVWHTEFGGASCQPPHCLVVDMGADIEVAGVRYLPRPGDAEAGGRIKDFRVYVSSQPFGLIPSK